MKKHPLSQISSKDPVESNPSRASIKQQAQASYERKWHLNPEQLDASRNALGRDRLQKTWDLIQKHFDLQEKKVADLGCGSGEIAKKLQLAGASIDVVDIASQPLALLKEVSTTHQAYVTHTPLKDGEYDLVVSTDVIAELPRSEYRLYLSEIGRLLKKDGLAVCSTPIDIYSEDALERFMALIYTEFNEKEWVLSRNAYYIKLLDFFKAPSRFVEGSQDENLRRKLLETKRGLKKWWFQGNTVKWMGYFWLPIKIMISPLLNWLEQSDSLLRFMENLCIKLSPETTVSHAICIGPKRPLFVKPEEPPPMERIQKQRIWQ